MDIHKIYVPSPTGAKFHADKRAIVKGLMGPIGSGKSVACIFELLFRMREQAPNREGVRRSRWVIIRNTYPELKETTIKTFSEWVPSECCPIRSEAPYSGTAWGPMDDGTTYEAEFLFLALDRPDDVKKLLSLECTGAWINEAREVPLTIVNGILGRTGRFPPKADAPTTWAGLIMDTNPPDTDHWYYRMAEVDKPEGYSFYRQPGGILEVAEGVYAPNPEAENIENLPLGYDYYLRQAKPGVDPNYIRVMLMAQYGTLSADRPVYTTFKENIHVAARPLEIHRNLPLLLGFDFGLTPACVFCQQLGGQLRVLRERFSDDSGLKQFLLSDVIPLLRSPEFAGLPVEAVGDPAGIQRAQADDTLSCFGILAMHGIPARPAPTNDFQPRRQAVLDLLGQLGPGGVPNLMLDPSCERVRKGFISGYRFNRKPGSDGTLFKDTPEKNQYSHIHDALQYAALKTVMPALREQRDRMNGFTAPPPPGGNGWNGYL